MVEIAGCGERWTRVERARPEEWKTAVDALLEAAQLVAGAGMSLRWLDEPCALRVEPTAGRAAALRVAGLTLVILDNHQQLMKTMPLGGALKTEAAKWLASHGIEPVAPSNGAATVPAPKQEVLANLERTLSNAHHVLSQIARMTHAAGPVRTDPVTLQTCTTIRLGTRAGESQRYITVGFGPGGDQGEFFVRTHPEAPAGAAVLSLAEVASESDGDVQARVIETFLAKSMADAYDHLSREWRPRTAPQT